MNGVVLYGAGGHCKVVIDILESLHISIAFLVDDSFTLPNFMGYRVQGDMGDYDKAIVTIGSCQMRRSIVNRISVKQYITAIHPSAILSPLTYIGSGTVVMQGAILQASSRIGNHCIVNTGALIEHDAVVHDFVHLASHSTLCGGVVVESGAWIGAGTTIIQGIHIGKNCMIGAGSVVVSDIPDGVVAYGNPCRVIKPYEI